MTDLTWLLVPLLVLPIVVLFRFAGCGSFGTEKKPPAPPSPPVQPLLPLPVDSVAKPKYATSILDKKEFVIAYWRLLEPAGSVQAIDEKGFRNGLYKEGQPLFLFEPPPGSNAPASEAAPGTFQAATNLIASDTTASRLFNGAYVHVEFLNGLYTDEFTIEAWVKPQWGPNMAAYRHTLFDASGTYALPGTEPALRGFLIFADLDGDVDGDSRWQVALGPGGDVFTFRPKVALGKTVHLAVTVQKVPGETNKKKVRLYLDGKEATSEVVDEYKRPDTEPLVIGVANAKGDNPEQDPVPTQPALSVIQEVVFYNRALTELELKDHVTLGT